MEQATTLQRTLNRKASPKTDMLIDVAQSISGILLVGFLWMHMLFVGTILLGEGVFNTLAHALDEYYLAQIGIPFIILLILIHIIIAGRRAPLRLRDLRISWRLTKMMGHTDTWIWVGQVVTALLVAILTSIHLWIILVEFPITSVISAIRVDSPLLWLYIVLLLTGEYHAGFGLYRIFVKWGWFERKKMGYLLKLITVIIITIGFAAMYAFKQIAATL